MLTWNRHLLLMSLPVLGVLILGSILLAQSTQISTPQLNLANVLILLLILAIACVCWLYLKGIEPLKKDFNSLKYSNFHTSMFRLLGEKEKKLFHKYITESIMTRDLDFGQRLEYIERNQKCQRILYEELNSTTFKEKLLSELSFERFQIEFSDPLVKSGWARDLLDYRSPMERAIYITGKYASEAAILNAMDRLKEIIIRNINIDFNGVRLDSKGLKEDITNLNNNVTKINLDYRIILNPNTNQKQFAQILDIFAQGCQTAFTPALFAAYFTGFNEYSDYRYNLPNIFKAYSIDLKGSDQKQFIKLIGYLVSRRIILEESNSCSKLARIVELCIDNYLKGHQLLRKELGKEIANNTLHPKIKREINSFIDIHIPIAINSVLK